jgi:ribonuclease P protein component
MVGPYLPGAAHAAAGNSLLATSAPFASANAKPTAARRIASRGLPKLPESLPECGSARFPKSARLLKRAAFDKVHASGKRSGCAYFSVISLYEESIGESIDSAKAGLTTPRRLGNAVVRNRLRRRMREAIRHELWRAQPGWAFVFHPRAAAADAPIERLRAELEKVFRRHRQ